MAWRPSDSHNTDGFLCGMSHICDYFAGSAALVEVCALLCAILVFVLYQQFNKRNLSSAMTAVNINSEVSISRGKVYAQ